MPKKHEHDDARIQYRIKSPEVWLAIRAGYEAGKSCAQLGRDFDVPNATVGYRRDKEGWRRRSTLDRLTEPAPLPVDALTIAETALARALEALAQGRASDAMGLIKAGDAVGAFADFVAKLRRDAPAAPPAPSPTGGEGL